MLFLRALFAVLVSSLVLISAAEEVSREEYEKKFFDWMKKYDIKPDTPEDFAHYLDNFIATDQFIARHNADPKYTFTVAHNKFSHMNSEEWKAFIINNSEFPDIKPSGIHRAPATLEDTLPPSMDWTKKGAVTPVKNQGQCGSCWSFSTTGAIEGASQIKYGKLVSLSEQNLLDCDNQGNNRGCNGGWPTRAFTWVQKNGGLCTGADYPYTSGKTLETGVCKKTCTNSPGTAVTSFVNVERNSDNALMSALVLQPVAVLVDASSDSFKNYYGGVYNDPNCGVKLNHAVLSTGYGSSWGKAYYRVKNSWGTGWGDRGYINLARGVNITQGQCGILASASYPQV